MWVPSSLNAELNPSLKPFANICSFVCLYKEEEEKRTTEEGRREKGEGRRKKEEGRSPLKTKLQKSKTLVDREAGDK